MLNADALAALIVAELSNTFEIESPETAQKFADAIARAVVAHIKGSSVTVTVTGGSSSGQHRGVID